MWKLLWAWVGFGISAYAPVPLHAASIHTNTRVSVVFSRPFPHSSWGGFGALVFPSLTRVPGQGIAVAGVSKNIHPTLRMSLSTGVLVNGHTSVPLLGINLTAQSAQRWMWKYQAFEQVFVVFNKDHVSTLWLQQLTLRTPAMLSWSYGIETQCAYNKTLDMAVGPVLSKHLSRHVLLSTSYQWHTHAPMQWWLRVGFML
jgi:hypothetical protein